jgi:hypothetical protein
MKSPPVFVKLNRCGWRFAKYHTAPGGSSLCSRKAGEPHKAVLPDKPAANFGLAALWKLVRKREHIPSPIVFVARFQTWTYSAEKPA